MPGNNKQKKRGERKHLAPSAATGQKGPSFESRVQAQRLLAMCLGDVPCVGVPTGHRITHLSFQARVHEHNTDDLVCTTADAYGATCRVLMQMKRTLVPSDGAFEEAVGLAWLDYITETFRRDVDRFVIAYDTGSKAAMQGAADIARLANSSTDNESWLRKTSRANFANEKQRKAYLAVCKALELYNKGPVSQEEVYRFLRHVEFAAHDLDSDSTAEVALLQWNIAAATRLAGLSPLPPDLVWSKLITVCLGLNGDAGEVDLSNVGRFLGIELYARLAASQARIAGPLVVVSPTDGLHAVAETRYAVVAPVRPSLPDGDMFPSARTTSANGIISRQLDHIGSQVKDGRFSDALGALSALGEDLEPFDAHQQARWYLMRGTCLWHANDDEAQACEDFLKAASLSADDDKLAAAGVRGLLLRGDKSEALVAANAALARFPDSLPVWISCTNAKILLGNKVSENDIPAMHASDAAAYQLVASAMRRAGDLAGATRVALSALDKTNVSLFTRESALRYALERATLSPLQSAFRMAAPGALADLQRAADEFNPRQQRLWHSQSLNVRSAAVSHLAQAYLLLGKPEETLHLLDEARIQGVDDAQMLLRPHIEALRDLGREHAAIAFGLPHLEGMPEDALVSFAQVAANVLDENALQSALEVGFQRAGADDRLKEALTALRWDVALRQGRADSVVEEARKQQVATLPSVPLLVLTARASIAVGNQALADECIAKATALGSASSEPGLKYLVAQLLFVAKRFRDAVDYYEAILPAGALSELHTDLLFCLIQSGLLAKARSLITSFPPSWREHRLARHMAMDLGQRAGDWPFLETLVEPQLRDEPKKAMSWLFKAMTSARLGKTDEERVALTLPDELEGSVRELTQLASMEIQYGAPDKGLRRLYRMRRVRLGETEAAAAHLTAVMFAPSLQAIHETPEAVGPGTAVSLVDETGVERWRTLDHEGMEGLPSTDEFCQPTSPEGRALLGLHVGDSVGQYKVGAIATADARLVALSHDSLETTLTPSKIATPLRLPVDAKGDTDFSPMVRQLEQRARKVERVFKAYGEGHVTLGIVASMLGTDVPSLVLNWPRDGPPLQVGGGGLAERGAAIDLLGRDMPIVVDASALTELAQANALTMLGSLKRRPIVTSATRDLFGGMLNKQQVARREGVAFARDGQLGFQELTEEQRTAERQRLELIWAAIDMHCEVRPAYGPEQASVELLEFGRVLEVEEFSVLLAAKELDAALLTLDGRLRSVASNFEISGTWPQALLLRSRGSAIGPVDYSRAVLSMAFANRNFISLEVEDLLIMVAQGDAWLDFGVNRLRSYLSRTDLDLQSAVGVVRDFVLLLYRRGNCQFGACLELFEDLLEPLLRHPSCPAGLADEMCGSLASSFDKFRTGDHEALFRAFGARAAARARLQSQHVVVKARVLFISAPPTVLNGLTGAELADWLNPSGTLVSSEGSTEGTAESPD